MKPTLTLTTALLLAPLAALHAGRKLPGVPRFGKLPAGSFQTLETSGAMADDDKPTEKPQKKKRRQKASPPAPQQ